MSHIVISVIIPTHNRPEKLADTLACLKQQSLPATEYEIIVVDDGSSPPMILPEDAEGPSCTLVRLEGTERSAARNAGATVAKGDLLIFVDDDIIVRDDFLEVHLRAHREWPDALVVGRISLPREALVEPFGRFRQRLEQQFVPTNRALTAMRNLCTAANMSISRDLFQKLEGFEHRIVSSEDQDLALRHTARGGRIVYLPEARALHRDSALDIRSYCRRAEWGSEQMMPFCQRHPDLPDNLERERINGPVKWGEESLAQSLRKVIKAVLANRVVIEALFRVASLLERLAPTSAALDRVYRLLLGIHIFRGYRRGLKRYGAVPGAEHRFAQAVE